MTKRRQTFRRRLRQSDVLSRAAGSLAARYIIAVCRTSKAIIEPPDAIERLAGAGPVIAAMWHGQFLLLPVLKPKGMPVRAMVARHSDGELIARTLLKFGIHLIRGAGAGESGKNRGGSGALRGALSALDEGATVFMTADVPPGPARVPGMGIVMLAKLSGRPIVPVAIATKRFVALPTWSRFTVNLPFSKLGGATGTPIYVPAGASDAEMEGYRQTLKAAMDDMTQRAYELAGSDARKVAPRVKTGARKSGFMLRIYRAVTFLAQPAAGRIVRGRLAQGKELPDRFSERFGIPGKPRPPGDVVWFHAASIGETNAILPLIDEIVRRYPAVNVLLTTITVTSAAIAKARLPRGAIHQFLPLDGPRFVRRFLRYWRPRLGVFTESEIWPNLIVEAKAHDVPLVLVNGHMSQRSAKRWGKLRSLSEPVFSRFDAVLTQNWRIAKRFTGLGARRTIVSGNLKYDAPPPPVDAAELGQLKATIGGRRVFLAASTHPGEEEIILAAYTAVRASVPDVIAVIAPRHPNRGEAVETLCRSLGLTAARRSHGGETTLETSVYIADTVGELGLFYSIASVAFIGGSLVGHGGQSPIEAVKLGAAIVCGPHTWNLEDTYRALDRQGGCRRVSGPGDLADAMLAFLGNPALAGESHRHAVIALGGLGGALEKTLDVLKPYLDSMPPQRGQEPPHAPAMRPGVEAHAA